MLWKKDLKDNFKWQKCTVDRDRFGPKHFDLGKVSGNILVPWNQVGKNSSKKPIFFLSGQKMSLGWVKKYPGQSPFGPLFIAGHKDSLVLSSLKLTHNGLKQTPDL